MGALGNINLQLYRFYRKVDKGLSNCCIIIYSQVSITKKFRRIKEKKKFGSSAAKNNSSQIRQYQAQ